ncbi:hypothetical protein [Halalkalibacter alkalisediminis]|uniref:Uncharacterized protein n=1 Tax=Halalkalibacter alkalisediminis TaxID=935616 RepID=A0ABV6NC21_9BACI
MSIKQAFSSSELGTLWMAYQQNTMLSRILDYFINKSVDTDAWRS